MGLLKQIRPGEWRGEVTQRHYFAPQECEQSAESQEREASKALPLHVRKAKQGSPEEALYAMQEEALSNVQRSDLTDTSLAYRAFCALHPEFDGTDDYNAGQLCEYFALNGIPIVAFNGANVPLATSVDKWEAAYQWKMGMGTMKVNPSVMDAQKRNEAQRKAQEEIERQRNEPTEDELYAMPMAAFEKLARGQQE